MSVLRTPGDLILDNGRQINISLAEPQLQQNPFHVHVQCDRLEMKSEAVNSRHASFCARIQAYERDEESIEWSKNIGETVISNVADHLMHGLKYFFFYF